jgi:hypothetical protein
MTLRLRLSMRRWMQHAGCLADAQSNLIRPTSHPSAAQALWMGSAKSSKAELCWSPRICSWGSVSLQ